MWQLSHTTYCCASQAHGVKLRECRGQTCAVLLAGVRQSNAAAVRSCAYGSGKTGAAFIKDDEDEFGLQGAAQAMFFHVAGYTWVPARPWEVATGGCMVLSPAAAQETALPDSTAGCADPVRGKWVMDEQKLSAEVRQHLRWFQVAEHSSACFPSVSASL